ncbi:hypothetical protein [Cellulomonas chengniuliangii]|uniref:DUF4190 domain-containing protein n=1 Tax=Cellulomonas chengniuliangii TaxID=2968084 RepID=A0ABY5KYI9_9CELL|nr:hypothetical protein [Cellulomonas chengniuliangii]MCC2307645.1 hypothetical protein [Cellulomonas chengniuliangii]UUI75590.1 hypothetical protein NP064_01295 [Cellulomonas chengniuliangii]
MAQSAGASSQPEPPASPLYAPPVLRNPRARAGLILGAVSILVNPVLLCSIAAIVVSGLGLQRAGQMTQFGYAPVGRKQAIGGLVLGAVGLIASITLKGGML